MKIQYQIFTNPITGSMAIGLPDGPPVAKFKRGQEAEAKIKLDQLNPPLVFHDRAALEKNGFEFVESFLNMPTYPDMMRMSKSQNVSLGHVTAFRFEDGSWGAFYVKDADKSREYRETPVMGL